jgi:replication factor C small subunit
MENTKKHTLWVEKYRPISLTNYIGNEVIKENIEHYLKQNDIPHFLFYGSPGTGKTTLARLIINNIDCDSLYINASNERGIDTIRDKVQGFASSASFKPLKVIILDEADYLTVQAQASLRNIIETFSRSTRFILTCNYVERVIDPLQSRCQVLKIVPPSKKEVASHIVEILKQENITYDIRNIAVLVNKFYPDVRKILNSCQLFSNSGELKIEESALVSATYQNKILNELKTSKDWKNIRQIIADSNVEDFSDLYRFLFDKIFEYGLENEGEIVILIEEYQYHSNFRVDQEINIMALFSKILKVIK